jgi:hypothetical protein
MSTFEQKQIERYLPELTKLSHDARLELIARLSESLKGNKTSEEEPFSFSKFCGAWESDETAEELMQSIRDLRTPNRVIEW